MRNCFVPNCDAACKNILKRMMFLPPKNETIFNMWVDVLPKKRKLKKHDRVCERHFHKSDISTTWDHIIGGVLHQLERGKPKLKATAVPVLNLPIEWNSPTSDSDVDKDKVDTTYTAESNKKKTKRRKRTSMSSVYLVEENVNLEENNIIPMKKKLKEDIEQPTAINNDANERTIDNMIFKDTNEFTESSMFDSLYDDIYEVVLPSTLWGIHRDPEREFIVFSLYDIGTMSSSRALYINNALEVKMYILNRLITIEESREITIDNINDFLSELDSYRTCVSLNRKQKNLCNVLAEENLDFCIQCSKNVL